MIRIIAGKHKKRKLNAVPGRSTRPTSDFNREMIFSTYQDFEDKRVLDLFAGTGAFGLEAISRGAAWVDFVEFASPAIATLISNIELIGCQNDCHVYRKKVQSFIKSANQSYDVIFLDPPYDKNLINPTLQSLYESGILADDAVIIAERSRKEKIDPALAQYVIKEKEGNTCSFSWLSAKPHDASY
jgi:16S rRNA (guanine966-N2)-methyltransferase